MTSWSSCGLQLPVTSRSTPVQGQVKYLLGGYSRSLPGQHKDSRLLKVSRVVCRSVIISLKGGKLHFHVPFEALLVQINVGIAFVMTDLVVVIFVIIRETLSQEKTAWLDEKEKVIRYVYLHI